jgi:hypothetical protein
MRASALFVGSIGLVFVSLREGRLWLLMNFRPVAAGVLLLLCGAVVMMQNHPMRESALFVASAFLAWEWGRQLYYATNSIPAKRPVPPKLRYAGTVICALVGWSTISLDGAALVRHWVMTRGSAITVAAFGGTPLADLYVPWPRSNEGAPLQRSDLEQNDFWRRDKYETAPYETHFLYSEVLRLIDALDILRDEGSDSKRILTLYFSNPYPALTHTPSPLPVLLWWHFERTFSRTRFLPAHLVFGQSAIVLETKMDSVYEPTPNGITQRELAMLYGAYIQENYALVTETHYWRRWDRRAKR